MTAVRIVALTVAFTACLESFGVQPQAAERPWRIFPVSYALGGIATGTDGALWLTVTPPGLLRVTVHGDISYVSLPFTAPDAIVGGPDGRIYFGDDPGFFGVEIAAYNPRTRVLSAYPASGPSGDVRFGGNILSIGALIWFSEQEHLASMTHDGRVTEYPYPVLANSGVPSSMAAGPSGTIWYTDDLGIAEFDIATARTRYIPLPPKECPEGAGFVAARSDGSIYAWCGSYFARVDPTGGHLRTFGPFNTEVGGVIGAPDGRFYFGPMYPNVLGVFDPDNGTVVLDYTPNGDGVGALTIGPDQNVWFVMGASWAIGSHTLSPHRTSAR